MKTLTLTIQNGRIVNLEKLEHLATGLGNGEWRVRLDQPIEDLRISRMRKLYKLIGDASNYTGYTKEEMKLIMKQETGFMEGDEPRSLSTASAEELGWLLDEWTAFCVNTFGFEGSE